MSFQAGDVVRMKTGLVDWDLRWSPREGWWWMKSGMTGRNKLVREDQIKPWKPHAGR